MRRSLCLLVLAACAPEPDLPADLPAGPFALLWSAEKTQVELGARVPLRLWMRVADDVAAEPPDVAAAYTGIDGRLRATDGGAWISREGERVFVRGYELQWMRTGTRTLPPLEHRASRRRDAGEELTAATGELVFQVVTMLPEGAGLEAELPRDVIVDPPPRPWWPWLAGAAVVAGLGFLAWRLRQRRNRRVAAGPATVFLPPEQIALARLKELQRMLQSGQIGGERLIVEVSDVLRRWIHDGLSMHALDRTTEEFLQELGADTRLGSELRHLLQAFLVQCDLVKFAAQRPDLEQCRSLLSAARDFVVATSERKDAEAAAEPPVAAAAGGSGG